MAQRYRKEIFDLIKVGQTNQYIFMCEKRVVWESQVKEHAKKCLVVTPSQN
jgi:hypothetical protein